MGTAATLPTLCVLCQSPLQSGEKLVRCRDCRTVYHAECWEENGGCGVYGCAQVPRVEHRDELEIPAAYWGQERKPCPACGTQILAAATRCRQCGATFASARPEDRREFRSRQQREHQVPKLRSQAVKLFVCGVIPFLAPIAALAGAIWFGVHREEIKGLPRVHATLARLGLGIAVAQTAFAIFAAILFSIAAP